MPTEWPPKKPAPKPSGPDPVAVRRPETLEAALAWLNESPRSIVFHGGVILVVNHWSNPEKLGTGIVRNGDIPAAIVEAVGQVWDQVNQPAA